MRRDKDRYARGLPDVVEGRLYIRLTSSCLTWIVRGLVGVCTFSCCTWWTLQVGSFQLLGCRWRTLIYLLTRQAKLRDGKAPKICITSAKLLKAGGETWRSLLPNGSLVPFRLTERGGWSSDRGKGTVRNATNTVVVHCTICQSWCLLIYF